MTPAVLAQLPTIATLADPLTAARLRVAGMRYARATDDRARHELRARIHTLLARTWRYSQYRTDSGVEVLVSITTPDVLARMLHKRATEATDRG